MRGVPAEMTTEPRAAKSALSEVEIREAMRLVGWPKSTGPARRAIVVLLREIDAYKRTIEIMQDPRYREAMDRPMSDDGEIISADEYARRIGLDDEESPSGNFEEVGPLTRNGLDVDLL